MNGQWPYWTFLALAVATVAVAVVALVVRALRRPSLPPPPAEVKPELAPPVAAPPAERPKPLREGLSRTRGGFVARLAGLLSKKEIDPALLDQLEEILLTADIGVRTSQKLFSSVRERLDRDHLRESDAVWQAMKEESRRLVDLAAPPLDVARAKPFVILTIGVNGVGKTTTIGKLAARLMGDGKRVLLAAGDTFRAAATEQLEVWGGRVGAEVVKGKEGGDPSAVIFDAVKRAKEQGVDVVIADTAGRLHTKTDLMQELQKVRRVVQKIDPTAPHETLLVLDATNGQNAIAQAQTFKQAMDITGVVLTKLDGTAKGGVILGIVDELKVPVRFIGIGEKVVDLREFDPGEFVEALFERSEAAA